MAHGREQATFDRHLPFWEAHKLPILVVSPEDDPVKTRHQMLLTARASHSGDEALGRLKCMIEALCRTTFRYHLIFEYDSICLDPERVKFQPGLYGNLFKNLDGKEISNFMAWIYPNPPWLVDINSLRKMRNVMNEYPISEHGFADRFLAALAVCAGVPILHHIPRGYSRAPLELGAHWKELKQAISKGGRMIHGIKTESVLNRVVEIYQT